MKFTEKKLLPLSAAITSRAARLSAICLVATTLAACGGGDNSGGTSGGDMNGGSGTDPLGSGGDTTINPIANFPPSTDDRDGDGLLNEEEIQLGLDPDSADSDNNGVADGNEDFDGDLISNFDEALAGTLFDGLDNNEIVAPPPPATDRCNDPDSANHDWSDNCLLKNGGTWAISSYTKGMQRVLWCTGFGTGNATTIEGFSDGNFGPNTDQAVRDYQTDRGFLVDGKVGPETWGGMQDDLRIVDSLSDLTRDAYSVEGCTEVLFYNETNGPDLLGWTMASQPGSTIEVPFSSAAP